MRITVYDNNGIPIASGLTAVTFTATPTSVLDASVSSSGGTAQITLSMDNQTGNVVFASPSDGSSSTPAFRVLVAADLTSALVSPPPIGTTTPNTGYFSALREKIGGFFAIFTHANSADRTYTLPDATTTLVGTDTTQTLTNKSIAASEINSGQLAVAQGGTHLATLTAHGLIVGNGTSDPTFLTPGAVNTFLESNGTDWAAKAPLDNIVILRDEKAQNTAGGTFTSGSLQTRTLNTEVTDTGNLVSLSSNQFTPAAGVYKIFSSSPAYRVNEHQSVLRNVTDSTTVLIGTSEESSTTSAVTTRSIVQGVFSTAGSKAFEIQHQCASTLATNGFGVPVNQRTEVYTVVYLEKIG